MDTSTGYHAVLAALRKQADDMDEQIVLLLSRRQDLTRRMMHYKHSVGLLPSDTEREKSQNTLLGLMADEHRLDATMLVEIYDVIRRYAKKDYPEDYSWGD